MLTTVNTKPLLHPQEIETYYVIPTLRRLIALELAKSGMKQKDVAALLGINSAAISQYKSNKRGKHVQFPKDIMQEISHASSKITDTLSYYTQIQHLLKKIRTSKVLCQIHQQFSEVPTNCHPEKVGCHKTI